MKILHITPAYEPAWHLGGVVRSVGLLCRGQARIGQEVTVFTTDSGGTKRMEVPVNQPVWRNGVKVYYFKTNYFISYAYSRELRDACRHLIKDFDIVNLHSFWNYPHIPAVSSCIKHDISFIIHTHGSFTKYSLSIQPFKKWLYMKLFKKIEMEHASALRFTAEMEREQSPFNYLRTPSFIVPNGLDVSEFDQLPGQYISRKEIGVGADGKIILFLGRLDRRKALDYLLKAFATAKTNLSNTSLILAGPDKDQEVKLRTLAKDLNIDSEVLFTGYIPPEKRNYLLRAADLLVLATHPGENFGNVAVEAMLAGIPVLLSEHVGISREVAADGAGLVVPLKVDSIADALSNMLCNPGRLKAMGEAGVVSARRRYEYESVARQMVLAYHDILTGHRSPALCWVEGGESKLG